MSILGITFDLEGTIIDIEAAHHNGHLAAAGEFGLVISLEQAYTTLPHFIGGPDEKVCEDIWMLLDNAIRNRVSVADILARDQFHYERLLAEVPIEPRLGFMEFCEQVLCMGLKVAIGSVNPKKQVLTILGQSGLHGFFDTKNIVCREDVEILKPAPDVFLKTASIMGVDPSEQLVFEDSPHGVKAALAAGSKAVGMPVVIRGETVAALVDAGVCRIFFDWREINASALIKNLG